MQGYKEFTVHMSSFHGGLDMVMAMDGREEVGFRITRIIRFQHALYICVNNFQVFGSISNLVR